MRCAACGAQQTGQVWYEAVLPPPQVTWRNDEVPTASAMAYKRWACQKCGRYHFPDGKLYSNPFKSE